MSLSIQSCIRDKKDLDWSLEQKQWKVVNEVLWMASTHAMPNGKEMTVLEITKWVSAVKTYITGEN